MPFTYNAKNELLLNNNLDKSFQNILKPLNLLHSTIFLKKYVIRDNFITSNCLFTMIYSFCAVISIVSIHCYFTIENLVESIKSNIPVLYIYYSHDLVVYTIILFCSYIFNVYYSNNSVKLVLKLQQADRVTNFSKKNFSFIVWNWLIALTVFFYSVAYTVYYYYFDRFTFLLVVTYSVLVSFIYACRIMSLMTNNIYLWIELLKSEFQKLKDEERDGGENYRKIYKCYMDLFDAFIFFKKSHEFLVRIYFFYF